MPDITNLILNTIGIVAGIFLLLYALKIARSKFLKNAAEKDMRAIAPYWAAQSPFKNGIESANALKGAWFAVHGADALENLLRGNEAHFEGHKDSYDADPESWVSVIEKAKDRFVDPQLLQLAKAFARLEQLNHDFVLEKGYRLEVIEDSDGKTSIIARNLETNETELVEVESEKEKTERAVSKLGKFIYDSELEEGRALLEFLAYWYNVAREDDEKLDTLPADEVGKMYKVFVDYLNEGVEDNEDLEIVVQQFAELRDDYMRAEQENPSSSTTDEDADNECIIQQGKALYDSNSEEGKALCSFVEKYAQDVYPDEPMTAYKVGLSYGQLLVLDKQDEINNPGVRNYIKNFRALYDAYAQTFDAE